MKVEARTAVGTGGKGPLCKPKSELLLGGEREISVRIVNGMKKKSKITLCAQVHVSMLSMD